eukprot:11181470-Lingulodinium_polyedra.AAC.1
MNELDNTSVVYGMQCLAVVPSTSATGKQTGLKFCTTKDISKLIMPFTGRVSLMPSVTSVPFCNAYGLQFFVDGFSPPGARETEVTTCLAWL